MNSAVDRNCARGSYKSYLRNDREVPQSTLRSRAIAVVTSNVDNAQCSRQLQLNDVTMDMEHEYPYSIDVQQQSRSWNIHGNSEYSDRLSVSNRSNSDQSIRPPILALLQHFGSVYHSSRATRDSLYEGSRISKEEGYLLLLHFTIRHHLSDVALEHLIELIDLLLPNSVFRSQQVTVGRGSTRVYSGDVGSSRTLRQHEQDCKICMQGGKIVRGIKGPSILMLLPVFNIVTSFTPDYLHSILLGVVKTFTEAWFDSAYNDHGILAPRRLSLIENY
ncbi:uncharacterized protein LOC116848100 [Odontomachus brunneus]|uniref:uncharacterized protein LOC116848100 n=1 Tax=Odontomachus brunneus TaxID=486640 RepID=UPI0013F1A510|nr:uncharacterized protein LOC116848100 [Odontomachus brunneus]